MSTRDRVVVVGGGVAGLTAGMFCARADLRTRVINYGSSILNRNAHLENYPGFPGGVDARRFLRMLEDQAEEAGVRRTQARVTDVERGPGVGFLVSYEGKTLTAGALIAASWPNCEYLHRLDPDTDERGSKQFLDVDSSGETTVPGLFAAGRIAGVAHQTVVTAGHGAQVALRVIERIRPDYYHDWVVPQGYFTGRDREVPPGCEEIDRAERLERDRQSRRTQKTYLQDLDPEDPQPHPSQSSGTE